MTTKATETATHTLEVAKLKTQRLPLSDNPPDNPLTREHLEKLHAVYWWLAEAGDEYIEQADALRDIYCICQNILDVEAGKKQGYLDNEGRPIAPEGG